MERGQNIFDDDAFFEGYSRLRQGENYNDLLEQSAMRELTPDVAGLDVLDVGCGWGGNCAAFSDAGARSVLGIDISGKMLSRARRENSRPNVEYRRVDMGELEVLEGGYGLVYSSLAFHYARDFQKLMEDISRLLRPGGTLLFSQEHPIVTATEGLRGHFILDGSGEPEYYAFSDYFKSGLRVSKWFVEGVEDHHRTMGEIVTSIARAGLRIEILSEPAPSEEAIRRLPALKKELIKPAFLLIRAMKPAERSFKMQDAE